MPEWPCVLSDFDSRVKECRRFFGRVYFFGVILGLRTQETPPQVTTTTKKGCALRCQKQTRVTLRFIRDFHSRVKECRRFFGRVYSFGMILGLRIQETPPQAKNTAEFSDARSRRWWPCVLFQASEPHFRSPFPVIGEGFAHPGAFAPSTTCERKAQINSSRCRFGRSSLSLCLSCPLRQRIFSSLCTVCAGSAGAEKAIG